MRVADKMKSSELENDIGESGLVHSSQTAPHPRLEMVLRRHLDTENQDPLKRATIEAHSALKTLAGDLSVQPFILDSGCGTGKSTQMLARQYPEHLVIGADRSSHRLAKCGVTSGISRVGNCILMRAGLSSLWRLLLRDGYFPEYHFLLYPNPYPKPAHLLRRWHGHPVFPQLLMLGGRIELRSNWEIYAVEFAEAVRIATGHASGISQMKPESAISPFERKYHERGQSLFSVVVPERVTAAFRSTREGRI